MLLRPVPQPLTLGAAPGARAHLQGSAFAPPLFPLGQLEHLTIASAIDESRLPTQAPSSSSLPAGFRGEKRLSRRAVYKTHLSLTSILLASPLAVMDQMMGGGDGGLGGQAGFPLETWFWEMPFCTRWWTTATVLTSALVQCQIVTPFQLFYSFRAVFVKSQYWRLLTTFLYFGPLNLDLVFHVFFLQRYSRLLEESSGRSPAHFSWLLLYSTTCLICLSPLVSMPFLGHPLSSTLVYIWSRRNPDTRLSFLGLLVFTAPYLPWVLMAFSLILHGIVPKDEIMGVVIGHIWYFFCDVYPPLHNGSRPFDPPMWWRRIFEGRLRDETADAINNEIAVAAAPAPEVR